MSAVPVPSCCLISCNFHVLSHYLASESYPFHLVSVLACLAHNLFLLSDSAPYLCSMTTHSTLFPMTDSALKSPLRDVLCFPLSWFNSSSLRNCLEIYSHTLFFFPYFPFPLTLSFICCCLSLLLHVKL